MRLVKSIIKVILIVVFGIILSALLILLVDSHQRSYLKIDVKSDRFSQNYLIKNVNIIPMDTDTVLSNKMIHIKEGKIYQIADSIEVVDAQILDGENQYLMPGLIDMHVHVWDEYELGLYLANGITAVRNLWGLPMHLDMKKAIMNDEIIAPLFYTSGPKLTGPEFIGDDNLNLSSPEEAKEKITAYKQKGYDFIKTYYGLTPKIFDAIISEAKAQNIDIAAHPSQKVPFSYHLQAEIKTIEHAEEIVQQPLAFDLDTVKLRPIIDSIASYPNARYSPTLTVFYNIYQMMENEHILTDTRLDYMNPLIRKVDSKAQFDRWDTAKKQDSSVMQRIKSQHDFHMTIVRKLHEAGVSIVCGTDAGIGVTLPGFSIHDELAFYKEAGLTNFEVLQTATVHAAETHSIMANQGRIKENYLANVILLKENPLERLETLQEPRMVFVKGRKLTSSNLNEFKAKAVSRNNLLSTALRYAEYMLFVR